jgi:hypothetical protein
MVAISESRENINSWVHYVYGALRIQRTSVT